MGDWYLQPDPIRPGQSVWVYDRNAPSPGRQPAVTMIQSAVTPTPKPRGNQEPADGLPDVPPRVDDWCEDRPPGELTDDDGWD